MNSKEIIINNLQKIALRLIEEKNWNILCNIANFLRSFDRGNWESLPYDEQNYWLGILVDILGIYGLYDHWGNDNQLLKESNEYLYYYKKAIEKKI